MKIKAVSWKYRKTFLKAQDKFESNDYEAAEQLFSEVVGEGTNVVPEALLHRAYTRMRMGKLELALSDASKCVELRPDSGVMLMIQGEIHLEQKDFMAARNVLTKAIALEKDNGRAYYGLARACAGMGLKGEAAEYFELALQFERDYAFGHFMAEMLSKKD